MSRVEKHLIPEPRFTIGDIVYDHWPEQYIECWHVKQVVTGVRFDHQTGELDYQISPLHDITPHLSRNMERSDGYKEEDLQTYPRTPQEAASCSHCFDGVRVNLLNGGRSEKYPCEFCTNKRPKIGIEE